MRRLCLCFLLVCAGCSAKKIEEPSQVIAPNAHDTVTEKELQEDIPAPDSVYCIETRLSDIFIRQSFYPVIFRLETVRRRNGRCEPIDSIFGYVETSTPMEKVVYDPANDWYTYWSEGEGTGNFTRRHHFLKVTKGGFRELFSYLEYKSDIDVESAIPRRCESVESKVIEMNRKRIRLLATYEDGYEQLNHRIRNTRTMTDTVTFLSDPATGIFSWHRSSNPAFERFWKEWWYPE